jgi:hypothetical protein
MIVPAWTETCRSKCYNFKLFYHFYDFITVYFSWNNKVFLCCSGFRQFWSLLRNNFIALFQLCSENESLTHANCMSRYCNGTVHQQSIAVESLWWLLQRQVVTLITVCPRSSCVPHCRNHTCALSRSWNITLFFKLIPNRQINPQLPTLQYHI